MAAVEARLSTALEERITLVADPSTGSRCRVSSAPGHSLLVVSATTAGGVVDARRIDRIHRCAPERTIRAPRSGERVPVPDFSRRRWPREIAPKRAHPGASAPDVRARGSCPSRPAHRGDAAVDVLVYSGTRPQRLGATRAVVLSRMRVATATRAHPARRVSTQGLEDASGSQWEQANLQVEQARMMLG